MDLLVFRGHYPYSSREYRGLILVRYCEDDSESNTNLREERNTYMQMFGLATTLICIALLAHLPYTDSPTRGWGS